MNKNEQTFLTEENTGKQTVQTTEPRTYSESDVEAMRQAHAEELRKLGDELHDVKVRYALDGLLAKSGARNPGFLRNMVNIREIPLDEGGAPVLSGVMELLDNLRSSDSYLFESPKESGNGAADGGYRVPAAADEGQMSDSEYYAHRLRRR